MRSSRDRVRRVQKRKLGRMELMAVLMTPLYCIAFVIALPFYLLFRNKRG